MNQVEITGILTDAAEGRREFLLRLPGTITPIACQLECSDTGWKNAYPLGSRVLVKGMLASRDLSKTNPCGCGTVTNIIESYIRVAEIKEAPDPTFTKNVVTVSGWILATPKFITTPSKKFYSTRIRMDDKTGFVTITTAEPSGEKGDCVTIHGRLQVKDYKRRMECTCCKKEAFYPLLSVLVRQLD